MAESASTPLRQSKLHNRLVIDLETTEELGKLTHFLVDVKNHQVEGFVCRRGLLSLENMPIQWVQVESIGQDSILVRHRGAVIPERFDAALTLERQAVWGDAGNHVGQLVDFCIDLTTGAVTQYLFTAPGWQGLTDGLYTFAPAAVVSAGKKRILVRQAALDQAPQFAPGMPDRFTQTWQQDVDQTRQDVQGALNSTREVAEQVQQQTQKLTGQARSQLGQLLGQVKQRSKQIRSQVNDRFADAAASWPLEKDQKPGQVPGTTIDVESEEVWPDQ